MRGSPTHGRPITMTAPSHACCPEFLRTSCHRRQLLRVGVVSVAGLSLSQLLEAEERGAARNATARSCILLYQVGGPSHLDTFDPKPEAPAEIRGEFATIPTSVPGIRCVEHFPKLAALSKR